MKKMLKKGLSIVLSLAMVVTSTTFYNTTAKADEGELYRMMTSATSNLALGCDALSGYAAFSGTEGDLTKLTDGTDNGRVYPQTQKNGSYTVDLGKYYTVNSIDRIVFMYNETNAETWPSKSGGYTISYSQDGMVFYDIKTITGLTTDNWESSGSWSMLDAQDVSDTTVDDISCVRYVKVTYPDSYTWGVQLREFAVLNVNNNAEEVTPITVSKPAGLSAESNEYNTITGTITAGENQEKYKYNLYLDGKFVLTTVAGEYKITEVAEGSHTVSVKSLYNGFTSDAIEVTNVDVKDGFKFTSTTTGDALPTVTEFNDYTNFDYVTATATSGDGSLAIDNNEGTRWESGSSDEQSITVDLKFVYNVKQIDMRWEAANAKDYNVEVSTDGNNYQSVAPVRGASTGGRIDSITFTDAIQARYVRIQGITRNTGYGYSIWEMAVYGEDSYIEPFVLSALTDAYIYNAVDAGKGYQVAFKDGNVFDRVEGDSYSYIVTVNGHDYEVSKSKAYIDLSDAGLAVGEAYTGTIKAKYVAADGTVTESDPVTTAEFTYKDKAVETYDTGVAKVIVNTARTSSTKNINLYQDTSKTKVNSEVVVKDAEGNVEACNFGTFNVRGNTTSMAQKKAYNIKFDSKQNLFGMGSAKKWSLLANCFDKTLMRNQVAFGFHDYLESTHVSGQAYSSMCKPVDLYVDGKYLGSYLLIESVEAGSTRVDIVAENTANTEVLLEIDNASRDVGADAHLANVTLDAEGKLASYEIYKSGLGMIFTVNEPGEDGTDNMAAYTEYMEMYADKLNKTTAFLDNFEAALKSKNYEAIKQYIDIESFVDFYITSELFKTKDIGFSSTRYYIKENAEGTPILYAGPLWDLDLSSGNSGDSPGYNDFFAQTQNPWFGALMAVPEFKSAVVARWAEILPTAANLYKKGGAIDQTYAQLKKSADANYSLAYNEFATGENKETGWVLTALYGASHVLGENIHGSSVIYDTYEEYVAEYKTWVENRVNWLSQQWGVENEYGDVNIKNVEGDVTLSWTDVSADSYDVTYTVYDSENGNASKTVNVNGTSMVITDILANESTVTVVANTGDDSVELGRTTAYADLDIVDVVFNKKNYVVGDNVSVSLVVKNNGCAIAVPSEDVISSTLNVDGEQKSYTVEYKGPVNPGENADYSFTMGWNGATAGEHEAQIKVDEREHVTESNEANNIWTGKVSVYNAYDLVTTDAKITGFQMSTLLGENNDEIGVRTVYQREELVNEQNVTEFGLVIGLAGQLQDAEKEMILGTDNAYVTSYAATEAGIIDAQMGDSDTATYYAMTMPIGSGYDVDYSVRPYAVLEDGSVVYGVVESYNVYAIAKDLYDNNKMSTAAAHNALYEVISAVDPNAEAVDYNWNNTLVAKADSLEDANSVDVNVEGFQMSASYNGVQGDMGLRIVYSVEGECEEAGLVYGLVYGDNPISASDMVVGSDNKFVVDYAATEKGLLDCSFGSSTADYYARTMSVSSSKKSNYYTATYYVRAYAKAADGTVKYSGVYSYSINRIADALYQNDLMSTYAGHEALYTNILTRVDENYKEVDYSWDKTLVR